ncbi:hypothetical protein GCM10010359_20850 [Streptomyces morookaense]|nr:hypothetical protein GCM10010359_20850 [Streptomyces morookaense]
MPKTGGLALAFHSKAVKKLPWSCERALAARTVRKTAMAAMITRSRIPEPRESARKTRSPARVAALPCCRAGEGPAPGAGGGLAVADVMSMGFLRSAEPVPFAGHGSWRGGAPDGAAGSRAVREPAAPGQEMFATVSRTFLAISAGSGA